MRDLELRPQAGVEPLHPQQNFRFAVPASFRPEDMNCLGAGVKGKTSGYLGLRLHSIAIAEHTLKRKEKNKKFRVTGKPVLMDGVFVM